MRAFFIVACALFLSVPTIASAEEPDLELGEEIFEICAPCHGPFGQGGGGGVYPRVAGMSAAYTATELRKFKSRERENIPMLPYATEREMPEEDVLAVAAYMETLVLDTALPPMVEGQDALERLNQMKQVLNVPRADGDIEAGQADYEADCVRCHGRTGMGSDRGPLLAGQHTQYLRSQIKNFVDGERAHKATDTLFKPRSETSLQNILAYLSILDDGGDGDDDDDDD